MQRLVASKSRNSALSTRSPERIRVRSCSSARVHTDDGVLAELVDKVHGLHIVAILIATGVSASDFARALPDTVAVDPEEADFIVVHVAKNAVEDIVPNL